MDCPNEFKNKITLPIIQLFGIGFLVLFFVIMITVLILKPFLQLDSAHEWFYLLYWCIFSIFLFNITKDIGISPLLSLKHWWKNKNTHFKIALKYFLIYAGILILLIGILTVLSVFIEEFAGYSLSVGKSSDFLRIGKALKSKPEIIFFIFSSCIFAPIVEEVFYRRFLFVALRKKMNFLPSLLISSFIFGITHANIIMATIASLYLGYVYEKEKSLPTNILLHSMLNISTIALLIFISSKSF